MKGKELVVLGGAALIGFILYKKFVKTPTQQETSVWGGGGFSLPSLNQMDYVFGAAKDYGSAIAQNELTNLSKNLASGQAYLADLQQQAAQTARGSAVQLTLPKSSGSYTGTPFQALPQYTYTSPQVYQMSVAPDKVQAVVKQFSAGAQTPQVASVKTAQSILLGQKSANDLLLGK